MSWEQPIETLHTSSNTTISCGICFQNTTNQTSKQMVCCRDKHVCTECFRSLVLTNNISPNDGSSQDGIRMGHRRRRRRRHNRGGTRAQNQTNTRHTITCCWRQKYINMYVNKVVCLRCPFCRQYVLFDLTYTYKRIKLTGVVTLILSIIHLMTIRRTIETRYYNSYADCLVYYIIMFHDLHCIFSNNSRNKWMFSVLIQLVSIYGLCAAHPMEPLYFTFLIAYGVLFGLSVLLYLFIGIGEFVATHYHYILQSVLEVDVNYNNIRTLAS